MAIYFDKEGSKPADYTTDKVMVASLESDTKSEIKDSLDQMTIIGWPEGYSLGFGSTVMTVDMDYAKYDSTGHWHWLGERTS